MLQHTKARNKQVQDNIFSIWYAAQYGKCQRLETMLGLPRSLDDTSPPRMDITTARHPKTTWTALHYASKFGQLEIMQLLLAYDPEIVHVLDLHTDESALHLCAEFSSVEGCRLLLEYGARMEWKTRAGQTAQDLARRMNKRDVMSFFDSWHALDEGRVTFHLDDAAAAAHSASMLGVDTAQKKGVEENVEKIRLERQALQAKEDEFGPQHPSLIVTLSQLAKLYQENRPRMSSELGTKTKSSRAMQMLERALDIASHVYGKSSKEFAILQNNYALECRWMQLHAGHAENQNVSVLLDTSWRIFHTLWTLEKKAAPCIDVDKHELHQLEQWMIQCQESLAMVYAETQDHQRAIDCLLIVIATRELHLGSGHPQLIISYQFMAQEWMKLFEYDAAEKAWKKALEIATHIGFQQQLSISRSFDGLAQIQVFRKDYPEARILFRQSEAQLMILYGASAWHHDEVLRVQNNLAMLDVLLQSPPEYPIACDQLLAQLQLQAKTKGDHR